MEYKKSMSQKLRMAGRDYSCPGWYFVTLGADYHKQMFGVVEKGVMCQNALGLLVEQCWAAIPRHYGHIELGARQVMPNHFHGLVRIVKPGNKSLGEVMNVFKGAVTREWRRTLSPALAGTNQPIWAPNYYDVIYFDAEQLEVKERYIRANPRRWALRSVSEGFYGDMRYKGNLALLDVPEEKIALRVSRGNMKIASHCFNDIKHLAKDPTLFNGVVFSTFFSPGEHLCLETLLKGKAMLVWVLPVAMPKNIPVTWTDAFLAGRALWLSAFPDEQQEASRNSCEQANRWVEQFCGANAR
jgi:REP element-mobilizing transposase RayT